MGHERNGGFTAARAVAAALLACGLASCARVPENGALIADPYERLNRASHAVNKGLDTALIRPASKVYAAVTPTLVRFLISNGVSNLELPVDAANHLMQGNLLDATETVGRFGMNTVFGAAGLLDPATDFGLPHQPTDFGQTLHVWGAPEGAYVELPVLGPSTERDTVGRVVDTVINPLTYVTGSPQRELLLGARAADVLELRADSSKDIDEVLYNSDDSYVAVKSTYVQYRRRLLAGEGASTEDALPDIFSDPPAQ